MASSGSIRPLSQDAISQIKSSIAITSLNVVIIELLKNALDAQAHKVDIIVDYSRGNCSVEDDGLGILPAEFQDNAGLGKLYHTSKNDCITPTYGSRGSFLASLAALSLVSITSRHHKHYSQNTLSINRSQVISRLCPAPPQQRIAVFIHGTRVTVRDLFGNMPVRVKQRAIELEKRPGNGREWEDLRKGVIRLILAWPLSVRISIKDGLMGQKIHFQGPRLAENMAMLQPESNFIAHLCNTLSQGLLISSPEQKNWVPLNGATTEIRIRGAISLDPAPTKAVQFVSLGISPVGTQSRNNVLYEEINRLFENSSFGSLEEQRDQNDQETMRKREDRRDKSDVLTCRELRGSKKGTDRWPMFSFKIEVADPTTRNVIATRDESFVVKESLLSSIIELLRAMIFEFLKCNHFHIKSTRPSMFRQNYPSKGREDSSHVELGASTEKDVDCTEKTVQLYGMNCNRHFIGSISERGSQGMKNTRGRLEPSVITVRDRAESSFNMWPRVKSGRSKFAGKMSEQHSTTKFSGLETANNRQESPTPKPTARLNAMLTPPSNIAIPCINHTLAKSGKVMQLPFGNPPAIASMNLSTSHVRNGDSQVSNAVVSDKDDEILTWINPVTNESSLVNARTGLVVQSAREELSSHIVSSYKLRSLARVSVRENISPIDTPYPSHKRSAWIQDIVKDWKNPIFSPTELGIPQLSLEYADTKPQQLLYRDGNNHSQSETDASIQTSSVGLAGRISKIALQRAQLISQVDKKFILIKVPLDGAGCTAEGGRNARWLLAMVDQHAADERCRIEDLLAELCSEPCIDEFTLCEAGLRSRVRTMRLEEPFQFAMSERELELLRTFSRHFADWGILIEIPLVTKRKDQCREENIKVTSLPPGIIERCKTDPKLLIDLLRSETWRCHEEVLALRPSHESPNKSQVSVEKARVPESYAWLQRIHRCPRGILDILNSRSCRSAIMFNDELSDTQCDLLLLRLAKCAFPFQCAHGRPSLIPLVDLGVLHDQRLLSEQGFHDSQQPFGVRFKRWKHEMGEMIV